MSETERLAERRVTYTLEFGGRLYVVENVPARVDEETGEQFFAPRTVERLQETILGGEKPGKVLETSVYEYPGQKANRYPADTTPIAGMISRP